LGGTYHPRVKLAIQPVEGERCLGGIGREKTKAEEREIEGTRKSCKEIRVYNSQSIKGGALPIELGSESETGGTE